MSNTKPILFSWGFDPYKQGRLFLDSYMDLTQGNSQHLHGFFFRTQFQNTFVTMLVVDKEFSREDMEMYMKAPDVELLNRNIKRHINEIAFTKSGQNSVDFLRAMSR